MYGGRAPKGELCNKVCMYVCMYVKNKEERHILKKYH